MYKIVDRNSKRVYSSLISTKELAETIQKEHKENTIIVPESYQYKYSYRNNGWRWMEPIDI